MTNNELPEWAKIYKTKGHQVRKVGREYSLYRVTSRKVEGKSYPVLQQTYLGRITEKEGFIPARVQLTTRTKTMEFGLTDFIMRNFRRDLERSIFNSAAGFKEDTIRIAVIYHVFGATTEGVIRSTALSLGHEARLIEIGARRSKTVERLSAKIGELMSAAIPDGDDRKTLECLLRNCVATSEDAINGYCDEADEIIERWKMKKWQPRKK